MKIFYYANNLPYIFLSFSTFLKATCLEFSNCLKKKTQHISSYISLTPFHTKKYRQYNNITQTAFSLLVYYCLSFLNAWVLLQNWGHSISAACEPLKITCRAMALVQPFRNGTFQPAKQREEIWRKWEKAFLTTRTCARVQKW